MQVAARMGLLIEFDEITCVQHLLHQRVIFGIGTIAPVDLRGTGRGRYLINPSREYLELARHAFLTFGMPIKDRRDGKLRVLAWQGVVQHKYD
ncbi:hypothetical protein GCM10007902_35650 [Dyella nitratireducens]|nr:hypothetical protein GCM10007902_35650 [Dyella nitratireducens]